MKGLGLTAVGILYLFVFWQALEVRRLERQLGQLTRQLASEAGKTSQVERGTDVRPVPHSAPKFTNLRPIGTPTRAESEKTQTKRGTDLALQEQCARQAEEKFMAMDLANNPLAGFVNHCNSGLGKCFLEVTDFDTKSDPGTIWISKLLSDAYEGKIYAEYDWHDDKGRKDSEVRPVECHVLSTSGETKVCSSMEEFDLLVKTYME